MISTATAPFLMATVSKSVFQKPDGQRMSFYVGEQVPPQDRDRLPGLIMQFGGEAEKHQAQAERVLVARGTEEADMCLKLLGGEGGKPILDYHWVAACVGAEILLDKDHSDNWGGFLITAPTERHVPMEIEHTNNSPRTPNLYSNPKMTDTRFAVPQFPDYSRAPSVLPTPPATVNAMQVTGPHGVYPMTQFVPGSSSDLPTPFSPNDLTQLANASFVNPSSQHSERSASVFPAAESSNHMSSPTPNSQSMYHPGSMRRSTSVLPVATPYNNFGRITDIQASPESSSRANSVMPPSHAQHGGPSNFVTYPEVPHSMRLAYGVRPSMAPPLPQRPYHNGLPSPSFGNEIYDNGMQSPSAQSPPTDQYALQQSYPPSPDLHHHPFRGVPQGVNQARQVFHQFPQPNSLYHGSMPFSQLAGPNMVPVAFLPYGMLPFIQQDIGQIRNRSNAFSVLPEQERQETSSSEANFSRDASDAHGSSPSAYALSRSVTERRDVRELAEQAEGRSSSISPIQDDLGRQPNVVTPSMATSTTARSPGMPSRSPKRQSSSYPEGISWERSTPRKSRHQPSEQGSSEKRLIPRRAAGPPKAIFKAPDGDSLRFFIPTGVTQEMDLLEAVKIHGGRGANLDYCDYVVLESFSSDMISRHRNKIVELGIPAVRPTWIHACIEAGRLVPEEEHTIEIPDSAYSDALVVTSSIAGQIPSGKRKHASAEHSESRKRRATGDVPAPSILSADEHSLLTAEDESVLPPPPRTLLPHGTGYRFTHEDSQYLIDYANVRFAQNSGLNFGAIIEEIARNARHHSLVSWKRYFREQKMVFEQYIHFPTPESALLEPDSVSANATAPSESPLPSLSPSPLPIGTKPSPDIRIPKSEPAVPGPLADSHLVVKAYTDEERQYFVDFLVWTYITNPDATRSSITHELSKRIIRHSANSWSSHWTKHMDDARRAQALASAYVSRTAANGDSLSANQTSVMDRQGKKPQQYIGPDRSGGPAPADSARYPIRNRSSSPQVQSQLLALAGPVSNEGLGFTGSSGRVPTPAALKATAEQAKGSRGSASSKRRPVGHPNIETSRSRSQPPQPPKISKMNSSGHPEYSTEDKEYVMNLIRWIVPQKPHISDIQLVEELATRATHHARNGWMAFVKKIKAEINECIREARQATSPPQLVPAQVLPSPKPVLVDQLHMRLFPLAYRQEECTPQQFEELVTYLEGLKGPFQLDEQTMAPFAECHDQHTVQGWLKIAQARMGEIQKAVLVRQAMLDSYIDLSGREEGM